MSVWLIAAISRTMLEAAGGDAKGLVKEKREGGVALLPDANEREE